MSGGLKWQRWKKKKAPSSASDRADGLHEGSSATRESKQLNEQELLERNYSIATTSNLSSTSSSVQTAANSSQIDNLFTGCSSSKRRKKSKGRGPSDKLIGNSNQPSLKHTEQCGRSSSSRRNCAGQMRADVSSSFDSSPSVPNVLVPASGVSLDNSKEKKPPVIPGFYYDDEKKRYFRILPGHGNGNMNVITTETVRQKEAEKMRQTLLERKPASTCNLKRLACVIHPTWRSLLQFQESKQRGWMRPSHFQRLAHENAIKEMTVTPHSLVTPFPDRYFDGESGYISHLELDTKQKYVLMVISDDYLSRLWQGEIVCKKNPQTGREESSITNWITVNILTTRNCKVTHTSWAQMGNGEDLYALYAISGGTTSSVQLFKCPSEEDGISHISYRYESNQEMAWTCAWSNSPTLPAHLAIGSTRKAIVVDTLSASKQKLHTCHSDVFSQVFSRKSPILFNGTRRGEVLGTDLRIPSHSHLDMTTVLRHSVSVCSIRLLQDENYLLASDMGGVIKLWDVRKCAAVQEYKGHHNENHHLPTKVDATESLLHAVGQDKYTRFWSMKTGELLHTIPCPSSCHEDNAPVALYSQKFSCQGQPGLFIGQERQILWYPLR